MTVILLVGQGMVADAMLSQVNELEARGYSLVKNSDPVANFLDLTYAEEKIKAVQPDIIIYAESSVPMNYFEDHKDEATSYYVKPVGNLINSFKGDFIYVSSSQIHSGMLSKKMAYTENNEPSPLSIVGHAIWAGELILPYSEAKTHIIRISSMFDTPSIDQYMSMMLSGTSFNFSDTRMNSPAHANHLAQGIAHYIYNIARMPRVLNIAGKDCISEYHFGIVLSNVFNINQKLIIKLSDEDETQAALALPYMPVNSGLDVSMARSLGVPIHSCYDGLKLAFNEIRKGIRN